MLSFPNEWTWLSLPVHTAKYFPTSSSSAAAASHIQGRPDVQGRRGTTQTKADVSDGAQPIEKIGVPNARGKRYAARAPNVLVCAKIIFKTEHYATFID